MPKGPGALYGAFVKRVEEIVKSDVEVYLTEVVADRFEVRRRGMMTL